MSSLSTDLKVLHTFLLERKLKYRIGPEKTRADGSCFLDMLLQNMKHLAKAGKWNKHIPSSVHALRSIFIDFMKLNKQDYVGFVNSDGNFVGGPLNEEQFEKLIDDQSRKNAHTDEEGFFVHCATKYLDVELVIVVTSIDSPVIHSGVGGPVQRINAGNDRPVFCAGLIRNETIRDGHYQFIYEHKEGELNTFIMPTETNTLLFEPRGIINLSCISFL